MSKRRAGFERLLRRAAARVRACHEREKQPSGPAQPVIASNNATNHRMP